jgi:hypothetical protein
MVRPPIPIQLTFVITPHHITSYRHHATEDLFHDPPTADHRLGATAHPHHKGRQSPGTLTHKMSRFEAHIPDEEQEGPVNGVVRCSRFCRLLLCSRSALGIHDVAGGDLAWCDPIAMLLASRVSTLTFATINDAIPLKVNDMDQRFGGLRVEPGRMAHPNARFHNNDYGDHTPQAEHSRPGTGRAPPGGRSSFTFG